MIRERLYSLAVVAAVGVGFGLLNGLIAVLIRHYL